MKRAYWASGPWKKAKRKLGRKFAVREKDRHAGIHGFSVASTCEHAGCHCWQRVAGFFLHFTLTSFSVSDQQQDRKFILTTIPEFPIQTTVGLFLGWILTKHFKHSAALWAWVLPAMVMLAMLVHGPIAEYGNHMNSTVFSHFFGGACRPQDRCLDQIIFTLPLCAAVGYSLGAALARSQKKGVAVFVAASA